MAYDTRELAVKITADASEFVKATDKVSGSTKDSQSSLEEFASGAKKASLVMAGVGVGLTAYAKNATDYTVNLVKSSKEISRETGVTVEQGSQLVYVAQRMGISADQASTVFGRFSKAITSASTDAADHTTKQRDLKLQIDQTQLALKENTDAITKNEVEQKKVADQIKKTGDATGGLASKAHLLADEHDKLTLNTQALNNKLSDLNIQSKESANAFEKLGINVLDAHGKTKGFNDLILETADKFKGMKDGTEKTTLAMELFGRSGKDMLPVLNQGSQGIQDLEKKADQLGLTLNAKTIASVSKYIQSQKDLKDSTNALKVQIGTLTAPVLTSFTQHINTATLALLSIHNPLHTLVADTLAFGGPVLAATAGLAGFAGNVATATAALGGFRAAAIASIAFMTGPWGIGIALATAAIAALVFGTTNQKSATEQLSNAQKTLKTDTDQLRDAQELLKNTQLGVEGAQLNVEQAQKNYNDAVSQFGPSSLEARQALHDLKQAQEDLKGAQDRAKDSLQQLHDKQNEVAKDKTLIKHLQETSDSIQGVGRDAFDAGQKIQTLNGAKVQVKTSKNAAGTQVIDFTSTFGGGVGHNADGTDYWQGGPTWVGEKGPEILVPPKGSQIIPADKSKQLAGGSGDVHFQVNIGMYAGMPVEKRKIALDMYKELVRAARSQGVSLPMIGAVGVQ